MVLALATPAPARTPTATDKDSSNNRVRMLQTSSERVTPLDSYFRWQKPIPARASVSTPNRIRRQTHSPAGK